MAAADDIAAPFVAGIVLAAGGSSRMGCPKQLLPLDGKPVLQHVVDHACASRLEEVIVVLGAHAEEISAALELPADGEGARIRVVVNRRWAQGQAGSLACGLKGCDPRAVGAAILLGDQPQVASELIDRVCLAFAAADHARTPFVRPVFTGGGARVPGHPVLAARSVWPELERLDGDAGARDLLAAQPERLLELSIDEAAPADLDTPEDYRRARA